MTLPRRANEALVTSLLAICLNAMAADEAARGTASDAQPVSCGPQAPALLRLSQQEILARQSTAFSAYILKGNERAYVLDYPTVREQGQTFGRAVLLLERDRAPRTKVLSSLELGLWLADHDQRIETLTVGNNFRADELARFFNTARRQREPLNKHEQSLYEWMLVTGLLRQQDAISVVGDAGTILISIPQASTVPGCGPCSVTMAHRAVILEHELAHARFVTDEAYRDKVLRFWREVIDEPARSKFTGFLRLRGYDAQNQELLANEMQAFLMHTPDQGMFSARALGMNEADVAELRQRFKATR